MAWAWRHSSNGLGPAEWQKNYSHTHRRSTGGVCGQVLSVEGHFITPQLWSLVVEELIRGLMNSSYTLGYALSSSAENSQILSQRFFRWLWVQNNSDVAQLRYQSIHTSFSIWINILCNQVTYMKSVRGALNYFKNVWGCSMHEYKGCKYIKCVQSAWFTAVPTPLVFYSVLF